MRAFPFLVVVALTILTWTCHMLAGTNFQVMMDREGVAPWFAMWVFRLQVLGAFWILPIIFIVYALMLSLRKEVPSAGSLFLFAGFALIFGVLLLGAVLFAQILSLHPIQGHFCDGTH